MEKCNWGSHCWMGPVFGIAWLLIASGLLTLTWNKVIATLTKAKPAKYWQALLLLATLGVLMAPRAYMRAKMCCGGDMKNCPMENAAKK